MLAFAACNPDTAETEEAKKVAVVISTLNNPWFVVLAESASENARALGYEAKIFDSQNNPATESDNFENLITGKALSLAKPQNEADASLYYRKDFSPEIKIPRDVQNQIMARTFPPFAPPYFMVGDRKFIITEEHDNQDNR